MSNDQQMPDGYSSLMGLYDLSTKSQSLGGSIKVKNVNDQYLSAFLLAFFLKRNQDADADSIVSAFETYFSSVLLLNVSEFMSVLEKVSKDLLDVIREELVVILKAKQSNKVREKFYDLDLYQQINTNMLGALVDGKKVKNLLSNKLSGFELISNKDFVGRFFWLNLQKEIADPTMNEQVFDNFKIGSIKDLIVNCQNRLQKKYQSYLNQLDACFERQISKNPSLFDSLTMSPDENKNKLSDNLRLMLFFLVGHTTLICLDLMLSTTMSKEDLEQIQVGATDTDSSDRLLLGISRGMLALGVIGCFVGLLPKKMR